MKKLVKLIEKAKLEKVDLYLDVGMRQHRDIGGCYEIKEKFALIGGKAVFCEGLDTHKFLHRTAFFLFLLFLLHCHYLHSKYCCVDIK